MPSRTPGHVPAPMSAPIITPFHAAGTAAGAPVAPERVQRLATLHHVLLDLERRGTIKINRNRATEQTQSDPEATTEDDSPAQGSSPKMWRPFDVS